MHADYGWNIILGQNVFINANSCFLDTCPIKIGSRTLVGPNVHFYAGTHPLDPLVRNGTKGPELGKPITIGEDCWIGGHVIILPGVTIGNGAVVGAGSTVTKASIPLNFNIDCFETYARHIGRAPIPRCGRQSCQSHPQD